MLTVPWKVVKCLCVNHHVLSLFLSVRSFNVQCVFFSFNFVYILVSLIFLYSTAALFGIIKIEDRNLLLDVPVKEISQYLTQL